MLTRHKVGLLGRIGRGIMGLLKIPLTLAYMPLRMLFLAPDHGTLKNYLVNNAEFLFRHTAADLITAVTGRVTDVELQDPGYFPIEIRKKRDFNPGIEFNNEKINNMRRNRYQLNDERYAEKYQSDKASAPSGLSTSAAVERRAAGAEINRHPSGKQQSQTATHASGADYHNTAGVKRGSMKTKAANNNAFANDNKAKQQVKPTAPSRNRFSA